MLVEAEVYPVITPGAFEAKTHMPSLLDRVAASEATLITAKVNASTDGYTAEDHARLIAAAPKWLGALEGLANRRESKSGDMPSKYVVVTYRVK